MKTYTAPSLTPLGDVASLTGFSGSDSQSDVIFVPNGQVILPGPSSEFACQIPNPTTNQCEDFGGRVQ